MYSSATRGGFKSEDTGEFLLLQNKYSKSLSWAENLNKLFTVLGGKFKFSAQDSDLEYLFWRSKNPPVSSDLKPPLSDEIGKFGQSALQLLGCLRIGALPSLLNSAGILSTYDDTESLLRTRAPTQLSLAAPSHNS